MTTHAARGAMSITLLGLGIALTACRPTIAPTAPEPRTAVPAHAPEALRVCWVESGRMAGFTASTVVVQHPEGTLLIDGGNSSRFHEEIEVYDGPERRWFAMLPGSLEPRHPLASLLEDEGIDPHALRWLLPTHAHLDHVGGFLDVPPTPVLLSEPELELVEQAQHDVRFEVIPAHARAIGPIAQTLTFTDEPYEIFDRHADLYGDGSVVVVPMPGHTPGSVGVFLNLPDQRRIFHIGDAVNNRGQIARLRGRSSAMRRTDSDRAQAERVVARLHALAESAPEIEMLPAHERRAWTDVFAEPGCAS